MYQHCWEILHKEKDIEFVCVHTNGSMNLHSCRLCLHFPYGTPINWCIVRISLNAINSGNSFFLFSFFLSDNILSWKGIKWILYVKVSVSVYQCIIGVSVLFYFILDTHRTDRNTMIKDSSLVNMINRKQNVENVMCLWISI